MEHRVLEKLTEDQRWGWLEARRMGGREEDRWPGCAAASSLEFTGEHGEIRECLQKALCPSEARKSVSCRQRVAGVASSGNSLCPSSYIKPRFLSNHSPQGPELALTASLGGKKSL